jgi:hypothetical protein
MEKLKILLLKIAIGFGSITFLVAAIGTLTQTKDSALTESDRSPSQQISKVQKEATSEANSKPIPTESFDTKTCKTRAYLYQSQAIKSACLGANLDQYPVEAIAFATRENTEFIIPEGFEKVTKDFDPLRDRRNVCIVYEDNSTGCLQLGKYQLNAKAEPEIKPEGTETATPQQRQTQWDT